MNQKLTLSMEQRAIDRGKRFASERKTSLSHVVETFLLLLDDGRDIRGSIPLSPKLRSLVGVGAGPISEEDYKRHKASRNA